jgi:K+-transporting ATPase KdpF subunit
MLALAMSNDELVSVILSVLVVVYLAYSLLFPEKF